jgi:hypothetical protein
VELGTFLSVELPGTSLLALVVRTTARAGAEWELACTFVAELGDKELEPFRTQTAVPPERDRRGWLRFRSSLEIIYQPLEVQPLAWRTALGIDVSATGIGLQVDRPLPLGSLLRVELFDGVMLAIVVRLSGPTEAGWQVGCNFVRELTEDEFARALEA